MALAGETIIAGKIPGERIATTIATANSAAITTTETTVMTVVAPVVVGRIYKVVADFGYDLSVAGDAFNATIREDSVSGTVVKLVRISTENLNGVIAAHFEAEYTADTTEDKTLVLTLDAASAAGNIVLSASATSPSYLYVDYNRGG